MVAGVIIHADKQWRGLERYLVDMVNDVIPPEMREGFFFHATELFHGTKRFHRDKFSKEYRWKILDELVRISEKFDLPIAFGYVPKNDFKKNFKLPGKAKDVELAALAVAFTVAAVSVNIYMKRGAAPDEVASITVENNDQARTLIKNQHDFVRNPVKVAQLDEEMRKHLPLDRIVDTITFAEKLDFSPYRLRMLAHSRLCGGCAKRLTANVSMILSNASW